MALHEKGSKKKTLGGHSSIALVKWTGTCQIEDLFPIRSRPGMTDQPEEPSEAESTGIDLSALLDTDFGPDWSGRRPESSGSPRERSGGRADRRPRKGGGKPQGDGKRPDRRRGNRDGPRERRETPPRPEKPFHQISFSATPETFKALSGKLKETGQAFELFELVSVLLAKPERFQVRINLPDEAAEEGRVLYVSKMDGMVFSSAEESLDHAVTTRGEDLYEIEETEVEPPSGNFPAVNRCGITGDWLGPPNFHRYAEMIREHHATKLAHVPYAKFEAKIETVREPEAATEWLELMRKARKYKLKKPAPDDPESFDSLEALRKYVCLRKSSALSRETVKTEMPGALLASMPEGRLKRDALNVLEQQRKFPLDTALSLLGRFRSAGFQHFKRGKKGVTYVCRHKRRRRDPKVTYSVSIESLFTFIESNPLVEKPSLPEQHLGLTAEQRETPEGKTALMGLVRDLRWLVTEGFVTEFADGRLETRPPASEPKAKKTKPAEVKKPEEETGSDSEVDLDPGLPEPMEEMEAEPMDEEQNEAPEDQPTHSDPKPEAKRNSEEKLDETSEEKPSPDSAPDSPPEA